jgi:hypothetical protein
MAGLAVFFITDGWKCNFVRRISFLASHCSARRDCFFVANLELATMEGCPTSTTDHRTLAVILYSNPVIESHVEMRL